MADSLVSQQAKRIGILLLLAAPIGSLLLLGKPAQVVPKAKATVSGRITYRGEALSSGIVIFFPEKGPSASGVIADGQYQIVGLALGPAKVAVWPASPNPCLSARPVLGRLGQEKGEFNHPLPPSSVLPPGMDPRTFDPRYQLRNVTYIRIPERYQDPDRSGLTIEVKNRQQIHDMDLQ